jgi:hypothetical protein
MYLGPQVSHNTVQVSLTEFCVVASQPRTANIELKKLITVATYLRVTFIKRRLSKMKKPHIQYQKKLEISASFQIYVYLVHKKRYIYIHTIIKQI